ncbi:calmodulin-regulated spectrin-associated protein 1-like isoform X8 [Lytechinus variegatus]|uniref:calmodulin-regulated spectrin-associated protein 1-like isoform X8 n=1 Tax=Lytechinus variegatus TaxID=7654 RepID=UPI001BB15C86|nr:calmodulin-regulated spectrin-associated protein 1-like isoform X8 [Lytechinus variegatus]
MDSIPEVIPMRSYNFRKAKLNSSVAWLLSKAYSDREEPPADLLDPLYQDNGEDHVKPSVIYQLASGELYSRVCSNIFPPTIHPWDGHVAIIQGFSRRGIHVVDDRNQPVTESILSQTQKIKLCESLPRAFKLLNAHVAMMDAIMKAYVNETISVENVVQAVRKFTTFNASSELPFDLEDALRFWINKVCLAVEHQVERDRKTHQANIMQSAAPAIRVKRDQVQPKEMLHFPKMNDMMKDLSDGCCLATIIHHYYPHLLSLEDVALHESMSFADSLHNLQVVTSFFQRNLPHLLHFTLEDLLYCHESMKYNIVALVAEMFWCFEVEKPSHLEANQVAQTFWCFQAKPAGLAGLGGIQSSAFTQMNTPLNMAARPPIPISDATKRSFHAPSPKAEMQSVDLTKVPSSPNSQRRLLNRQQQERSSIFGDTPGDENTPPSEYQNRSLQRSISREQQKQHPGSQSILAWEEKEKEERRTPDTATFTRPRRLQESPTVNMQSSRAGSLLANVSIDSEMNESQDFSGLDIEINPLPERMGSPNTQGQQHSEDRLMTLTHQRPVTQEGQLESEDLEVESLTSSRMSRQQGGFGETKESFNPMLTHRTDPVMNGVDGSQGATSSPGTFRGSQREHLDSAMSPASEAGSVDSSISRKNLKLDVHPVDILGSPRGPTNEFMPAVVRPLKEKSHQVRKTDERGDHLRHRNKHRSGDTRMTAAHQQYPDQGSDSSESVDATTPLSGESIADSLAGDLALQRARIARGVGPGGFMLAPASQSNQPQMAKGKHGEAFFISGSEQPLQDDGHHSFNAPTGAKSFTISEGAMTVDDAKEAGIPVVSASRSMQGLSEQGFRMRPGGMTSSQSDQEIYQPRPQHSHSFQNPVSSAAAPSSLPYSMHDSYSNPHNPHQYQPNPQFNPQSSNPQHANPHHGNPHHGNPHSNPHGNPHHDFRTHSPHHHISQPNPYDQQIDPEAYAHDQHGVSTWGHHQKQQQQQFHPHSTNPGAAGNGYHISSGETTKAGDGSVSSSELTHIRLRLEEKRRLMDYERHKLERQWNKQRQRVGKAAFLQVLANKKQEKEGNGEGYSRSEHQRNIENARPPQGLTTFAALSANREKTSQVSQEPPVSEQEQYQHPIQDKQLTQAYFLAQQNQMSQQTAQKTPRNQQPPPEHRAQQPSPSHLNQVQMAEGGRRSNESPRSGRDSESPRMRSESPGPRRTESPGSSSGSHSPHLTQEEYNTSLEKLNANLSQLQNQILRLSLQQEEFKKGMNESPRQVQESPRQVAQGDFGDQRDSPEHRDVHRPPSHPQQDSTGQMTGFYIESGDQKLSEQDSYVLEENPAFNIPQGQGISPQEMQHIQQSPQGFSLLPHNQPIDNFNEKQTVNAQRLSDVTYIKSEMNDNKYIIPDNLEHDAVVANAQIERTFSGQNLNIDNENQSQLKQMPTEEVHSPPANQRKGQPVMAFDIDMGSPKQPRAPPANQRKKEATPKKVQEKKSSPPRTPVKKQAPPSVYEIVGEGEEDVPVPSDMVVRPLEQLNASKDDDSADTSGMAAGFIIGEDDKAQDELAKRKEMFLKARLKREEEAKIKKASREAEAERKREELRKKQEEAEMKKAEQAARREQIRLEYQRKKQAELDPDSAPPPPRKQKSSRPRPKSQMVTSDKGPSHSHGYTALDSASDIALSVQKKSYTIESSSEGEIAGAVTGAAAGAAAAQGSENQTSASAPSTQGETPHPPPQGSAAAPPQSSATPQSASQAADQGTKKSPSSSGKPMPEAAKRRPPSPRPRSNTLPGSLRSPEKTSPQNAPQIQAPESGASVMSPQEGAVANVSPSVASQESSGSGGSQAADYSGPKLFVKPTSKSNRHIIINAISHCILAGVVNEKTKDKVLQEIAKSDQKHFMILFRDHSLQFRSLYGFTPESEELTKVYGTGPRHITNKMTEALYKYNSGGKHFAKVPSKSLSVQIDGITINSAFWQSKRPVSTKKH